MDDIEYMKRLLVKANRDNAYLASELDKHKSFAVFLGFMCIWLLGLVGLVVVW